jgi:hypothetical protein
VLSYTSMTLGGNAAAGQPAAQQAPPPPQKHDDDAIPTTASGAVMKGLGGMFKKKKEQQQQQEQEKQPSGAANPASTPGSLMDMRTEVTNYSNDSLDAGLFGPPAGYTQTQKSADDVLGGGAHK